MRALSATRMPWLEIGSLGPGPASEKRAAHSLRDGRLRAALAAPPAKEPGRVVFLAGEMPRLERTVARSMLHGRRMNPGFAEHPSSSDLRYAMVRQQLLPRGIRDRRVLRAMGKVPRHRFVPPELEWAAYEDRALPIGYEQTISQPYMVARMLEAARVTQKDRVLDVGTGSGYQAAVLGRLVAEVWSIEIVPELAESARRCLAELGCANVHVVTGDGSAGLPEHAPYDAIVVAAGSPDVPRALLEQLAQNGRLVIPVGDFGEQMLRRIERVNDSFMTEDLLYCMFVPLVGREGWTGERARRFRDVP